MLINSKLSDEELLQAIYDAASEYSNLVGNSYLIIGKNKKTDYVSFQCHFEEKHFMHLLGIHSKTLKATEFFDKCKSYNQGNSMAGIVLTDCTPSRNHSRTTVNEKSSCCAQMLRIQDAKYMKIGKKDKINQYVNFTYAYGNDATLGFMRQKDSSFPISLIPRGIDHFVTQKHKIIFVLKKNNDKDKYDTMVSEIKKGLFEQLYPEFPKEIQDMMDIDKLLPKGGSILSISEDILLM